MLNHNEMCQLLTEGTIMSHHDNVVVGWGKRLWFSQPQNLSAPIFYFPDFFLTSSTPWFTHEKNAEISPLELLSLLEKHACEKTEITWTEASKDNFKLEFDILQTKLQLGRLQKGVLYTFESHPNPLSLSQRALSLYSGLQHIAHSPLYFYGFWDDKEGLLGLTPEILFKQNQSHVEIDAIAGTCSHDAPDLRVDPKIVQEHTLVIDGIRDSLSAFGTLSISPIQQMTVGSLVHLKANIQLLLHTPLSMQDLIQKLHPTPALGTYPRLEGLPWLQEVAFRIPRKRYGAPVGVFWKNQSICYVAIRNVQWDKYGMKLFAGCGILLESRFEEEWKEIHLKLKAIKKLLTL
jgi:menaquinone-specific isochorismate synthase